MNWQAFLESRGVEYADCGPSTAKGNLYVRCPFCGDADQGRHMGISINGYGWGCWRDSSHRGKSNVRLVQALLGCSWVEAEAIVGKGKAGPTSDSSLLTSVRRALGWGESEAAIVPPQMPKTFKPLLYSRATPHYKYLLQRGYSPAQIEYLAEIYDLRACWYDDLEWNWRLIIPVYDQNDKLITWTGRSVGNAEPRYRSLTSDPNKAGDKPCARAAINDGFLSLPSYHPVSGDTLILVEGPFDTFTLDCYAHKFPFHVDCLFGKVVTPSQLDTLAAVRNYFNKVVIVLDPEASLDALKLGSQLQALNVTIHFLDGECDPGEMSRDQVMRLFDEIKSW